MNGNYLLNLEMHHAALIAEAETAEGNEREAALTIADGLIAALSTIRAGAFPAWVRKSSPCNAKLPAAGSRP